MKIAFPFVFIPPNSSCFPFPGNENNNPGWRNTNSTTPITTGAQSDIFFSFFFSWIKKGRSLWPRWEKLWLSVKKVVKVEVLRKWVKFLGKWCFEIWNNLEAQEKVWQVIVLGLFCTFVEGRVWLCVGGTRIWFGTFFYFTCVRINWTKDSLVPFSLDPWSFGLRWTIFFFIL